MDRGDTERDLGRAVRATGAAVVMAIAGILACWVPARRASRIDPLVALRVE